jgi:hypothetical protein
MYYAYFLLISGVNLQIPLLKKRLFYINFKKMTNFARRFFEI